MHIYAGYIYMRVELYNLWLNEDVTNDVTVSAHSV